MTPPLLTTHLRTSVPIETLTRVLSDAHTSFTEGINRERLPMQWHFKIMPVVQAQCKNDRESSKHQGDTQCTPLLGGPQPPPVFQKAPSRQFHLQNATWHPLTCKLGRGDVCVILDKNWRLEVADLHFGGCQFTFWRVPSYILEAEIFLGVLYRKGGNPKRGVLWVSPNHIIKFKSCEDFVAKSQHVM